MKDKGLDPRRLDVARLAAGGGSVEGHWPLADMTRLAAGAAAGSAQAVAWSARGECRSVAGTARPWLHVKAQAAVVLTCQRCLQPLTQELAVDRAFAFAADEAEAERLDEHSDEDVLALPPHGLDLQALVEDELILALPIVPRHERCPQPLPLPEDDPALAGEHPFRALAALKRPARGKPDED